MFNPRKFKTDTGKSILVGRNSSENNYLTLKVARAEDTFFHASDFAGSHVILQSNEEVVTRSDLEDAACLAAYYSKGRDNSSIKVDYTLRCNVKKPRKAPAGLVELSDFETLKVKKADRRIIKYLT